jgi:hypothetical protein
MLPRGFLASDFKTRPTTGRLRYWSLDISRQYLVDGNGTPQPWRNPSAHARLPRPEAATHVTWLITASGNCGGRS